MLRRPKRLVKPGDELASVGCPLTDDEISQRDQDYKNLSPKEFARLETQIYFRPVQLEIAKEGIHPIAVNSCDNPFCKSYGLPQAAIAMPSGGTHSRYNVTRGGQRGLPYIACQPIADGSEGITHRCTITALSNWSVAEEIARLIRMGAVVDRDPEYNFHSDVCGHPEATPFNTPGLFRKKGKREGSNSQRWQCKVCEKITNVMPAQRENQVYYQKRSELNLRFAKEVLAKGPIRRVAESLSCHPQTYYRKLEMLYKRCLEFLEKHETLALQSKAFDNIQLSTDQLIYFTNYIRRRGTRKERKQWGRDNKKRSDINKVLLSDNIDDVELALAALSIDPSEDALRRQTYVAITGENHSRYIFRCDVAYDSDISVHQIQDDTVRYREDHLRLPQRKNARFGDMSVCPQPPTIFDEEKFADYQKNYEQFMFRHQYIPGLHVDSGYTTMAHMWLIRHMLNAKNWLFVTDDDAALQRAIRTVFVDEIRSGLAHHVVCTFDNKKSLNQARREYWLGRRELLRWGRENGFGDLPFFNKLARAKLGDDLLGYKPYDIVTVDERLYRKPTKRSLVHPLPMIDHGYFSVRFTTDVFNLSTSKQVDLMMHATLKATDAFTSQVRRRLSVLERPLVTARAKGGKSYMYANGNPKYAQMVLTILRTWFNFCHTWKRGGIEKTPAQFLGIADRRYTMKDILYMK